MLVQTKLSRGTELGLSELQSPRRIQRPKPGPSMSLIWKSYQQELEALKGDFLKANLPPHPNARDCKKSCLGAKENWERRKKHILETL